VSEAAGRVRQAEAEEREARGALSRRLGLDGDVPAGALRDALGERTESLAEDGLTIQLEFVGIDDEPADSGPDGSAASAEVSPAEVSPADVATATLTTPGRSPELRELRLLKPLAQAALTSATIFVASQNELRTLEALGRDRESLARELEGAFAERTRREQVEMRLAEAETLLGQLVERATAVLHATDVMIAVLDDAANTADRKPSRRRAVRRRPKATLDAPEPTRRQRSVPERPSTPAAAPAVSASSTGDAFEP
jgi:hypothetical protein